MWKKIISLLLVICMLASVLPQIAFADGITVGQTETNQEQVGSKTKDLLWEYEINGDGVTLTKYFGTDADVYVPGSIETEDGENYPVLKLGDSIFENNDGINSATLGAGILEIGERAFYDADNMVCILISEQLTTIGDEAFYSCDNFNSIIIYDAVTNIGENAFEECPKLVIWCNEGNAGYQYAINNNILYQILSSSSEPIEHKKDGVTYYIMNGEAIAISFDGSVAELVIPASVNGSPVVELRETFKNCKTISNITLPKSLKSIGLRAFMGCSSLRKIDIPESVTNIDGNAFYNCSSLQEIKIPKSITTIGIDAFNYCNNLEKLYIEDLESWCNISFNSGAANPLKYAEQFYIDDELITELIFPETITNIGDYCFYGARVLNKVVLNDNLNSMGKYVFSNCSNLTEVIFGENLTFISNGTFSSCSKLELVMLPKELTEIEQYAFADCTNLDSIIIPEKVNKIDSYAFVNCNIMKAVIIPKGIQQIYSNSFSEYTLLLVCDGTQAAEKAQKNNWYYKTYTDASVMEVVTLNNVTYLIKDKEVYAIGCDFSVTEVNIPSVVQEYPVVELTGTFRNCTSLTKVNLPESLKTIGRSAFKNCDKMESIDIPSSVEKIGDSAFSNCTSLKNIEISSGVTILGNYAFYNCNNLVEISLPNRLESIGNYTFAYCNNLTEISLPNTLQYIGDYAFSCCKKLKQIEIPGNVSYIGSYVFHRCDDLAEVSIADGVTYVAEYMFWGCDSLKSINLPDSITKICHNAFAYSKNLNAVNMSNNIELIETSAFDNCSGLKEVNFPSSLTTIEEYAFGYCSSLETIELPEDLKVINSYVFDHCSGLKEVKLPSSLITIEDHAFAYCSSLETIELPDTLKTINYGAFYNCTSLEKIIIPRSVSSIGAFAFYPNRVLFVVYQNSYAHNYASENDYTYLVYDGTAESEGYINNGITYVIRNNEAIAIRSDASLTDVVIPETIAGYPVVELQETFANHTSLKSITLPKNLKTIGTKAFYGCTGLTSVNMQEGLGIIKENAFYGCTSLTSLAFPASVKKCEINAFGATDNLKHVYINDLEAWCNIDFADRTSTPLYAPWAGKHLYLNGERITTLIVPDSITIIKPFTFAQLTDVTKVIIPEGVETIDYWAFAYSINIQEVVIPKSVTRIGERAFFYCLNLDNIVIPNGVTKIEPNTFRYCQSLKNITISNSVTEIGENAFSLCIELEKIVVPDSVKKIGAYAFADCTSLVDVTLPYLSSFGDYLFARCTALKEITLPEGITMTSQYMFTGCTNLSKVNFPDSLKIVHCYAFYKCSNLKTINFNGNLTHIYAYAFNYCTSLEEIVFPNSLVFIGDYAFNNCSKLETVHFNNSLREIGNNAFSYCRELNSVMLPKGLTTVESSAFAHCGTMQKVYIPSTLTTISNSMFYGTGIDSLTISEGVKTIQANAFTTPIKKVIIPKSVTSIKSLGFGTNTLFMVYEDSYALNYMTQNNRWYFVIRNTNNPEISYGTEIHGKITDVNGISISNATVELYYSDGVLKESKQTDDKGNFSFTYAEVGKYIIRAIDSGNKIAVAQVSVMRKNVFDVFVSGDTNLILKQSWSISGTVSEDKADITLADENGNILDSIATTDGTFTFACVPNGSYIIKAESENASVTKEVTVFDGPVTGIRLEFSTEITSLWGYVEVEERNGKHNRRNWIQVSIYNEEGHMVSQGRSDIDGRYEFKNLPLGEYVIVAETAEMRSDKKYHYDRSYTLTGYGYINACEPKAYEVDTIILYEDNNSLTTVSGKVTANGETQDCEVLLQNVFRYEVAKQTTGKNGKYAFKNVKDGLYFITATTKSSGMGFAIVVVRNGRIYGETNIKVLKDRKVETIENAFFKDVPKCESREAVLQYRERIAQEKRSYDALSKKEKKQLSTDYIARLNQYCEWLGSCEYTTSKGVALSCGGLVLSSNELENEDNVVFSLSVTEREKHVLNGDGVNSDEDYIQHSMEDAAQKQHDYGILKYYEISMTKQIGENQAQTITSVYKNTEATGKFRITIDIPKEYRGYKNYAFVHVHNGEVVTLTDLDDDANTVTIEIDAFSTFALLGTNDERVGRFVVGDLDNDGDLTEVDVAIMRTYLAKEIEVFDFATSDVNVDGVIDIRDIVALKRSIAEGVLDDGENGVAGGEANSPEEEW